jgi:maltooligosyltrehalose trehalohydrolase
MAAAAYILSPYVPLLFMGEEHNDRSPFHYFVSYDDENLIEATRTGREKDFGWEGHTMPDPAAKSTFDASVLHHLEQGDEQGQALWRYYQKLLIMRRNLPALASMDKTALILRVESAPELLIIERTAPAGNCLLILNFKNEPAKTILHLKDNWNLVLDSGAAEWGGPGAANVAKLSPKGNIVEIAAETALVYCQGNEKP